MSDCNHPALKCMKCMREVDPKDVREPVSVAVDGRWLENEDTLVEMIDLFFSNNGVLDEGVADKLSTIIASRKTEHPAFEDIPISAYTEFDDYIPF